MRMGIDMTEMGSYANSEQFKNPPPSHRIIPGFGGHLGEVDIRHLKALGFGGVLYMPPKEGYLTDQDDWNHLEDLMQTFRENDLSIWIYDEEGFPSGAAGGQVLADYSEGEASGIYYSFLFADGGDAAQLDIPEGHPVLIGAAPVRNGILELEEMQAIDIEPGQGTVSWVSPDQRRWLLMAFTHTILYERTFAAFSDIKTPYHLPNLMDAAATERFIQLTHDRYFRRLGKHFGNTIPAFFTDEPCLLNYTGPKDADNAGDVVTAFPWHRDFPRWFSERYGYDFIKKLPALYHDCGVGTKKMRCDYWGLVAEKVETAYHRKISEWCNAHNVASSGHLLMEERLPWHVSMQGDYMRCLRHMQIPGIDVLVSKSEQSRPTDNYYKVALFLGAKFCSSIKHHYRRERAVSETSGYAQLMENEPYNADDVRATISWQYAMGIDTFITFYGGAGFSYGKDFFSPECWKQINSYTGRIGVCLAGGSHVCDLLVFYPIKSQWANHIKRKNGLAFEDSNLQEFLDTEYVEMSMDLLEHQRDFDYVHQQDLLPSTVHEGRIRITDEEYRVLILPPMDTEDAIVIEKAKAFAESGGIVLAVGRLPEHDAGGKDEVLQTRVQELFAADSKRVRFIRNRKDLIPTLDSLLAPDFTAAPESRQLLCVHRRKQCGDLYFVFNNSSEDWTGSVTLAGRGEVELWNPVDGSITPLRAEVTDRAVKVKIVIPRYCGELIVIGARA